MTHLLALLFAFFSAIAVFTDTLGPASSGLAVTVLLICWREIRALRRELARHEMRPGGGR